MADESVSATTIIGASPEVIFAILADPAHAHLPPLDKLGALRTAQLLLKRHRVSALSPARSMGPP
jgi:hypothetical protein